jgi:hypothetical protein
VRMRAAGCTISKSYQTNVRIIFHCVRCMMSDNFKRTFITVAPSFVMVCRPLASTSRRSPP